MITFKINMVATEVTFYMKLNLKMPMKILAMINECLALVTI